MSEIIIAALKDLKARQKELQPLVAEYREVDSAIQALEQAHQASPSAQGRGHKPNSGARRRRPRRGERTRSDQFLALVREQPGISITEATTRMGVRPNYLYRVVARLEEQGSVERRDRAVYPA